MREARPGCAHLEPHGSQIHVPIEYQRHLPKLSEHIECQNPCEGSMFEVIAHETIFASIPSPSSHWRRIRKKIYLIVIMIRFIIMKKSVSEFEHALMESRIPSKRRDGVKRAVLLL